MCLFCLDAQRREDRAKIVALRELFHGLVAALGLQERQQQIAVLVHRQTEADAVALAVAEALMSVGPEAGENEVNDRLIPLFRLKISNP